MSPFVIALVKSSAQERNLRGGKFFCSQSGFLCIGIVGGGYARKRSR